MFLEVLEGLERSGRLVGKQTFTKEFQKQGCKKMGVQKLGLSLSVGGAAPPEPSPATRGGALHEPLPDIYIRRTSIKKSGTPPCFQNSLVKPF